MFETVKQKLEHQAEEHKDGYKCPTCEEMLKTTDILCKHIAKKHKNKYRYACEVCANFKTNEKPQMAAHYDGKHPDFKGEKYADALIRCTKCGVVCSTRRYLNKGHKCKKGG